MIFKGLPLKEAPCQNPHHVFYKTSHRGAEWNDGPEYRSHNSIRKLIAKTKYSCHFSLMTFACSPQPQNFFGSLNLGPPSHHFSKRTSSKIFQTLVGYISLLQSDMARTLSRPSDWPQCSKLNVQAKDSLYSPHQISSCESCLKYHVKIMQTKEYQLHGSAISRWGSYVHGRFCLFLFQWIQYKACDIYIVRDYKEIWENLSCYNRNTKNKWINLLKPIKTYYFLQ